MIFKCFPVQWKCVVMKRKLNSMIFFSLISSIKKRKNMTTLVYVWTINVSCWDTYFYLARWTFNHVWQCHADLSILTFKTTLAVICGFKFPEQLNLVFGPIYLWPCFSLSLALSSRCPAALCLKFVLHQTLSFTSFPPHQGSNQTAQPF